MTPPSREGGVFYVLYNKMIFAKISKIAGEIALATNF